MIGDSAAESMVDNDLSRKNPPCLLGRVAITRVPGNYHIRLK